MSTSLFNEREKAINLSYSLLQKQNESVFLSTEVEHYK